MNVVDSSGWLEYFADEKNSNFFAPIIENTSELIVPVISIYEVFKKIISQRSENEGLYAVALMKQGLVVDIDEYISLIAAKLSVKYKLPMADSIILATAQKFQATLWTQDADFKGIDDVEYKIKKY